MVEFVWPVRVYYEDTDSGGVVYYANYLKFMERARTEWLRHLGYEQTHLHEREGVLFMVYSVEMRLRKPGRFNDLLQVVSRVEHAGKARLMFEQRIERAEDSVSLLCCGKVGVACVDALTWRPKAIPQRMWTEITGER